MALAFVLIWALALLPAACPAQPILDVYYFNRPPLYITEAEGRPGGLIIDAARRVFDKAKVEYRFVEFPNKRIVNVIQRQENACGVGWFKTRERRKFAVFSLPIYQDQPLCLLVNHAKSPRLPAKPTIAQALDSGLRLGVLDGFSYGYWADSKIAKHRPPSERVTTQQVNLLRMVAAGRVDFMLISPEEVFWLLSKNEDLKGEVVMLKLADAPAGNLRRIMFNRGMDPALVKRIDRAIESMKLTAESR